ncbi:AAA family ATPase [Parabacteroides sp.]
MLIERVRIKGFWNKYSLDWKLNRDVNLLSGINGSGKTTLLDVISSILLYGALLPRLEKKVEEVEIELTEGYRIICERKDDLFVVGYRHHDEIISQTDMVNLRIGMISTVDASLPNEDQYKRYLSFKKDKIRSELDMSVDKALEDYYKYLANISKEVEKAVKNKQENLATISSLYDRKELFIKKVNELFSPTHKKLDDTTSEIRFLLEDGMVIYPNELSSGEKQLLIVLILALKLDGRESIVFWDEPEISMHIDWQRALIRVAREINPFGQLIIATHSPSIIYEGWEKRIVNMEDLLRE